MILLLLLGCLATADIRHCGDACSPRGMKSVSWRACVCNGDDVKEEEE